MVSRDQQFGRVVALPTAVGLSQARDAGCLRLLQLDSEGPCLLPEKEMANLKPSLIRNRKYNGERQEGVGGGGLGETTLEWIELQINQLGPCLIRYI